MAGLIPQPFIEDLLERCSLVEVIRSRITLKKSGSSYKACCPFHQEKTPSFHVNAQKNFYHCFGCGAHGDAITFLREFDNLSFVEAIEELAKIQGVEVPRDTQASQFVSELKRLHTALTSTQARYLEALNTHPDAHTAKQYIEQRGLSPEIVERYGLGFAPAQSDFLSKQLEPQTLKALIDAKLVSNKYDRRFDLFQNRLMFPIRNMRGQVVGFGGRTLDGHQAKYINSPESAAFYKSKEIYGLYEAGQANRRLDELIVVEGYMDVIALAQFGVTNAVATLGTATNADNLSQLLKYTSRMVFCFDGDQAGFDAARKAMENILPLFQDGIEVRFLLLPQGEDPDTLVRKEGAEGFRDRVDRAQPLSNFFFTAYMTGLDMSVAEQRGVLRSRCEPSIALVQAAVLRAELKQALNEHIYRRNQSQQHTSKADSIDTGKALIKSQSVSLALGLYFAPAMARLWIDHLEQLLPGERGTQHFNQLQHLSQYCVHHQIETNAGLLKSMAMDTTLFCDTVQSLFNEIEYLPEPDAAVQDAHQLWERLNGKLEGLTTRLLGEKKPSEMTEEEKAKLREQYS